MNIIGGGGVALTDGRVPGRARHASWHVRERRLVGFQMFLVQATEVSCR